VLSSELQQFGPSMFAMRLARVDHRLTLNRGDRVEVSISYSRSISLSSRRIAKYVRAPCSSVHMLSVLSQHFHFERFEGELKFNFNRESSAIALTTVLITYKMNRSHIHLRALCV
jgi:NADH:ubiquinone oxidoreductase subunit B-like Fe-S oxidoreductase